ncbi:unnamed protein product [Caenorhabditis angaria]|uniref:G-protein coupled receptors family 1 profile domain-containing protein n=1 Tax=Caenorhabditis angaria TaxID=860376 RepID=A0A9P1N797_9PELO|nr:unnamed protein product [Caenorhabditis angaria]
MRTSSTNVVLLGMSLIDIFSMALEVYDDYDFLFQWDEFPDICYEPQSYYRVLISQIGMVAVSFSRLVSTYLSLSLVSIRAFAISKIMNPKFNFLTKPKTGWLTILANLICCGLICVPEILSYSIGSQEYFPAKECKKKYPENYKKPEYFCVISPWIISDISVQGLLDSVMAKHLPVVLFIIMTIVLIGAIRNASKNQENSGISRKDDSDKTSKLVLFTTISVIIAELPVGILYVVQSLCQDTPGWM